LLHPYNETSWDDQVLKESVEYRTLLATRHAAMTLPRCARWRWS